jgi:hypothetical protein
VKNPKVTRELVKAATDILRFYGFAEPGYHGIPHLNLVHALAAYNAASDVPVVPVAEALRIVDADNLTLAEQRKELTKAAKKFEDGQ